MTSAGIIAGTCSPSSEICRFRRCSPGTRWKIVGHRSGGRSIVYSPRLALVLLGRVHVRLAVPSMREQVAKIFPGLVELILVVAPRIFPIPHPRCGAGIQRAHGHPEIDGGTGALEAGPHRILRNRNRRIQPPGVRRRPAEETVEHALPDVADRRRIAVGVAHPGVGRRGIRSCARAVRPAPGRRAVR